MSVLVTLSGIEKAFAEQQLLSGADLVVREGDRIGLVGANGSGKTTLLRILAGVEPPDAGEVRTSKGMRLAWMEQEPALAAATAGEEVGAAHEGEALLDRLGLKPDADVARLSGGERRRVALARELARQPDLLLLDEPTNHLDALATAWLEDFLREQKVSLLFVTHDRYFLDRLSTRIVELEGGRLHSYGEGYLGFVERRAMRLHAERKAESTRLNLLWRESEWMRRGPQGRGTKAKARIRRYEELVAAGPADLAPDLELQIPPGPRLGSKVVRLKNVSCRGLIENLDLVIERDERIGIVGPNGAGKTTLLKLCMGEIEPDAGEVELGETAQFSYIDQDRADLDSNKSVLNEVSGGNSSVKVGDRWVRVEGFLGRFLFPKGAFQTRVGQLSGGERNRVLLAKLLLRGGNVLVLDEPTNDLDLMTLRGLEEALLAFDGAVIVVSHDRFFLDRVATRILYLDGKGGVRDWAGSVSDLLDDVRREQRPRRQKKPAVSRPRESDKLTYRDQRELDGLPDKIAVLEQEIVEIDTRLSDPQTYARKDVGKITARRGELATQLAALYARWEELE